MNVRQNCPPNKIGLRDQYQLIFSLSRDVADLSVALIQDYYSLLISIRTFFFSRFASVFRSYAPVKLFCPNPPRAGPGTSFFFVGCPGLLITTFLPCPALYKHSNHSFFKCPAPFYHLHFFSNPRTARTI